MDNMNDCVIDESDMAHHVRKSLEEYFRNLDGEKPCCGIYGMVICCVEKPLLEMALEHAGGNQSRASEILGINRNTLRKKMVQYGIAQ
jgi:Fis family transcriptional regulator